VPVADKTSEILSVKEVVREVAPVVVGPPEGFPEATLVEEVLEVSVEELWVGLVGRVRKERPLISMWVESGVLVEVNDKVARMAYSAEQKLASEYVLQANNRTFLEGILKDLTGRSLRLESGVQAGVQLRTVDRQSDSLAETKRDPMEEFKDDPLIRKALEIFKARIEQS
jgi:DNA polymerase-3 subunit gamma/tau